MANAPFKMPGFSGFGNESSPNKQQNMMDSAGAALAGALGAVTGGGVDKTGKTLTDTTGVPPHSHESGGVVPAEGMDAAANVAEAAVPEPQEEKKKPNLVKRILGGGLLGRMF